MQLNEEDTLVLKTRLIEKKVPKIRFRQSIGNCKTIPKMQYLKSGVKSFLQYGLFLTFAHEKTTFQGSKVVPEAILLTM